MDVSDLVSFLSDLYSSHHPWNYLFSAAVSHLTMTVGHSRFHIHEHGSLFGRPLGRSEVIQPLRLQLLEAPRVQELSGDSFNA